MIESTGDLLLRGLDDPDFRQPVLEPRHRASRGEVTHADRLVHRRRAGAQLPRPGLVDEALPLQADPRAPSMRARSGSPRSSRTPTRSRPRRRKERDEFQHKNEEFDEQRAALLSKATDEAQGRAPAAPRRGAQGRRRLRARSDGTRCERRGQLNQAIARRAQQEVFAIARKALADLADDEPGRADGRRLHAPPASMMDGDARSGSAERV